MRIKILILIALLCISSALAFDFTGYTYNITEGALANTNVTIEVYVLQPSQPPQLTASFSTLSTANGSFSIIGITENDSYVYKPVIRHYNGADVDYVGQSLPGFLLFDMQNLGPINFYLKEGTTVNITAVNRTGGTASFRYLIKDTKLGYPVKENFDTLVNQTTAYVPVDRNYSIMIYPNDAMPVSYDLNNISAYGASPHIDIQFNTTTNLAWVSGYVDYNGAVNFDNITILPYLLEPGRMVFEESLLPYNMSAWRLSSDFYNTTIGFFNITLPAAAMGSELLLFANVENGTDYFGAFKNISLSISGGDITNFNFSLQPLAGSSAKISMEKSDGGNINITTKKLKFRIQNSTGSAPKNAHVELEVDYTNYGGTTFSWMTDVSQEDDGNFSLPILNASIKKINVLTPEFAPKKTSKTASELIPPVNITMEDFNPGEIDPNETFTDLFIDLLRSDELCDIPNPVNCSLMPAEKNMSEFNPLSVIMGGGKISFRMKKASNNITIHYVNVDMIASGPPDVVFDTSSNDTTSGSSLEQAWRFGSGGPEIYDSVIIGIPYNESAIDETMPQVVLIKHLYDENWNAIWNSSDNPNGLNTTAFTDYSDFDQRWFNSSYGDGGMSCIDISLFNASVQGCYTDKTTNMNWLVIPHFSGLGPQITSIANLGTIASDKTSYQCWPSCTAYVNVTMNNGNLAGVQNITVNNTATVAGIIWTIEYLNLSNTSQWVKETDNNALIADYNLSVATHQFRLNITLPSALSTKWNFSIGINNTYYSLDPYLDSINLTYPDNNTNLTETTPAFNFTLYSNNFTTQDCVLYINSTAYGNTTAINGTPASITANSSLNDGSYNWLMHCNETGNSDTRIFTVAVPPSLTLDYPTAGLNISSLTINFTWTATDNTDTNLSCNLTIDSVFNTTEYGQNQFTVQRTLSEATHNWSTSCIDDIGALNTSATNIFTLDVTPPTTAPVLTAVNDSDADGNIELAWTADANAASYAIYRDYGAINTTNVGFGTVTNINNVTNTSFEDTDVGSTGTYWYAVASIDSAGNLNASYNISNSLNATSNDTILPKSPTNLNVTASGATATIVWNEVTQDVNGNADLSTKYKLYVGTSVNNSKSLVNDTNSGYSYVKTVSTNSTTYSVTSSGTYHFIVTSIDDANNENKSIILTDNYGNASLSYTAPTSSSSSTSSRTTTSDFVTTTTTTVPKVARIFTTINAGETAKMSITKSEIGFTEISITAANKANNVKITVKKLDKAPAVGTVEGNVYQYIQIDKSNIKNEDIEKAVIKFKIPKTWFDSEGVSEEDVVLSRYTTNWEDIPTTKKGEDTSSVYYEAETTGFSYFAVRAKEKVEEIPKEEITPPLPKEQEIVTPEEAKEEKAKEGKKGIEKIKPWKNHYLWIAVLTIIVIALAIYFFISKKKAE